MVSRIKKNDTIIVNSGKYKGEQGVVIDILPKKGKVMIKELFFVARHTKPRRQGETGGIKKQTRYVPLSIVMPLCSHCKKGCRVNVKRLDTDKKVRICNRCKEII